MDISFGYKQISLDIKWISLMDMTWISLRISDGYLQGYVLGNLWISYNISWITFVDMSWISEVDIPFG